MPRSVRLIFGSFYFFSGATALAFEIVWARLLEVILGSSTLAVASTLATFMGGLSLGSFIFGKGKTSQRPLFTYAILELGIGLYALLIPWIQSLLLIWPPGTIPKYLLSILLFIPPTVFMGGTFPAITQAFLHKKNETGLWTGLLYGANTMGAAIGALATGFFLIYILGLNIVNSLAAMINLSIGIFSFLLSKKNDLPIQANINPTPENTQKKFLALAATCLFLSGASSMIYEILWTRFLTLVLGSSTYAFTVVLVTFLLGLALGSLLVSKWVDRSPQPALLAFGLQIILCLFIFISLPLQDRLPLLFFEHFKKVEPSFWKIEALQFLLASIILLGPTLLIGASFPCFMKIGLGALPSWKIQIGPLYAINSLGAMLGSILGSLLLLPLLGLEKAIRVGIGFHLLTGTLLAWNSSLKRVWKSFLVIAPLLAGLAGTWIPEWNLKILTAGISVYAQNYSTLGIDQKQLLSEIERSKILFSKDGWTSHVTVREYAGVKSLLINGKADGSDGYDLQTELLSAHLPLLIHPDPKKVFVIGLGTGITLRAAEKHPVHSIDCVEIEKRVVEASEPFKKANHDSLSDPRLHLVVNDARHVLSWTDQKYDVIISEPSNPWLAGIGSLYTTEMFRQMEKHLEEDGIVCQWIHYYNMSSADLKTVVRTFQSVFPNASLWGQAHLSDLFLIGTKSKATHPPQILTERLKDPKIRKDLRSIQLANPHVLQALQWLDAEELKAYAGESPLNTDTHPILEFSAPRHLYQDTLATNVKELLTFRQSRYQPYEKSMTHFLRAMVHFYEKDISNYLEELTDAVRISPKWAKLASQYEEGIYQEAQQLFQKGQEKESLALLLKAGPFLPKSARIHYSIGYLYQKKKNWGLAQHFYLQAIQAKSKFSQAHNNLGVVYLHLGKNELARKAFQKALKIDPLYLEAHQNLAYCLLQQKALEGAELEFKLCLQINPNLASAYNGLGVILGMQKKYDEAIQQFKKALELDPNNTEAMKNLQRVLKELERD